MYKQTGVYLIESLSNNILKYLNKIINLLNVQLLKQTFNYLPVFNNKPWLSKSHIPCTLAKNNLNTFD